MDKKFLAVLVFAILVFGCSKKYPEGPKFALRTPLQRIVGNWTLETYLINGVDSISEFGAYSKKEVGLQQQTTGASAGYTIKIGNNTDTINFFYSTGYWGFLNNETTLKMEKKRITNVIGINGPLTQKQTINYDILRLTHLELWIRTDFENKTYELHFKK